MEWLARIPDLASLEGWVMGLLVLPVVVLGVPVILATVSVPRRLGIQPLGDDELSPAQGRWFAAVGESLGSLGFAVGPTFVAANLPGHNVCRAFRSGTDPAWALAMAISHSDQHTTLANNIVELSTTFRDGSAVNTRSSAITDLFELPEGCERFIHRSDDPAALARLHAAHCEPHRVRGGVHVSQDEFLLHFEKLHERWIAHQVERGLLKPRNEESCGATVKLALRGITSFFNPFGDRFSVARFVLGLVAGLALPLGVGFALGLPGVTLLADAQTSLGVGPELAGVLAMVPAFLLASVGVGWIFESRAVVWSPLLACVAARLALPASAEDPFARLAWLLCLLATPLVAQTASNWRHRRDRLA